LGQLTSDGIFDDPSSNRARQLALPFPFNR
jgi:hypothetical protein